MSENTQNGKLEMSEDERQQKLEEFEREREFFEGLVDMADQLTGPGEYLLYEEALKEGKYEEAMEHLHTSAEAGDKDAQYRLYIEYDNGLHLEENKEKAFYWLESAHQSGHAEATNSMGAFYMESNPPEYEIAFGLFKSAAENGSLSAMCNLGQMYYKGQGTQQNFQKAVLWWEKAASLGSYSAKNSLLLFYVEPVNSGMPRDEEKALYWMKQTMDACTDPEYLVQLRDTYELLTDTSDGDSHHDSYQDSKSGGGCYIATAVYGSYDDSKVVELRKFRDDFLERFVLGRLFIKTYYAFSPALAKKLASNSTITPYIRRFLDRFISYIKKGHFYEKH